MKYLAIFILVYFLSFLLVTFIQPAGDRNPDYFTNPGKLLTSDFWYRVILSGAVVGSYALWTA